MEDDHDYRGQFFLSIGTKKCPKLVTSELELVLRNAALVPFAVMEEGSYTTHKTYEV